MGWGDDLWDGATDWADSDFGVLDVAIPFYGATHALAKGAKWAGDQVGSGGNDDFKPFTGADGGNYRYGGNPGNPNGAVAGATGQALGTGKQAEAYGAEAADLSRDMSRTGSSLLNMREDDARRFRGREVQQGDFGAQNQSLSALGGLEAAQGPSAAQAQLQQGTNQALSSQLALARSGRGLGGNAAAMGLAQGNAAGIQANYANSAAALRAQEDAAWRGRQGQNLTNVAGMQGQQAQANLGAAVQGRSQNDAGYLSSMGMGQDAWLASQGAAMQGYGLGMQGTQAGLAGQGLAHDIRQSELNANIASEDAKMRAWAAENGYTLQQQQLADQKEAAYLNAGATFGASVLTSGASNAPEAGKAATRSDVRAKKNIVPGDQPAIDFARAGSMVDPRQPDFAALDAVREAPGSFYEYKDPGAPGADPGRHYGPMAQDLAKTPAGASAVVQQPDGALGVDTDRLSLVNTSAVAAQQRQLDQLAAELEAFKAQPGAQYAAPSHGSFR